MPPSLSCLVSKARFFLIVLTRWNAERHDQCRRLGGLPPARACCCPPVYQNGWRLRACADIHSSVRPEPSYQERLPDGCGLPMFYRRRLHYCSRAPERASVWMRPPRHKADTCADWSTKNGAVHVSDVAGEISAYAR